MLAARRVDACSGRAYRSAMDSGRFRRRTIALVAAYAVALQTLFAAFVPVALAASAGPFAVLCSHDADGTGQPAQHDLPCAALCAAMGHGVAGPVPPDIVVAIAVPHAIAALAPVSDWVPPQIAPTRHAGSARPAARLISDRFEPSVARHQARRNAHRRVNFGALP